MRLLESAGPATRRAVVINDITVSQTATLESQYSADLEGREPAGPASATTNGILKALSRRAAIGREGGSKTEVDRTDRSAHPARKSVVWGGSHPPRHTRFALTPATGLRTQQVVTYGGALCGTIRESHRRVVREAESLGDTTSGDSPSSHRCIPARTHCHRYDIFRLLADDEVVTAHDRERQAQDNGVDADRTARAGSRASDSGLPTPLALPPGAAMIRSPVGIGG